MAAQSSDRKGISMAFSGCHCQQETLNPEDKGSDIAGKDVKTELNFIALRKNHFLFHSEF